MAVHVLFVVEHTPVILPKLSVPLVTGIYMPTLRLPVRSHHLRTLGPYRQSVLILH